jgi:hypothetical protein
MLKRNWLSLDRIEYRGPFIGEAQLQPPASENQLRPPKSEAYRGAGEWVKSSFLLFFSFFVVSRLPMPLSCVIRFIRFILCLTVFLSAVGALAEASVS